MQTLTYTLLLRPERDGLLEHVSALAQELFAADGNWSDPVTAADATGTHQVSHCGPATLKLGTDSASKAGWLELRGFASGGCVRWWLDGPARLQLFELDDAEIDTIWGATRCFQDAELRAWVRSKDLGVQRTAASAPVGLRGLIQALVPSTETAPRAILPKVAQPPFAPDDFPEWLYSGELSSVPRLVEAANLVLAGIAHASEPELRLLVRPLQDHGGQSIVPITKMKRGQTFAGPFHTTRYSSAATVGTRIAEMLGRLEGKNSQPGMAESRANPKGYAQEARNNIPPPQLKKRRQTSPSVLHISRLGELQQLSVQPFEEAGAVVRVPGSQLVVRILEVRAPFAAHTAPDLRIEVHADGLADGCQLFVGGAGRGSAGFSLNAFTIGPKGRADDLLALCEMALG